ncbi:hypothetical protein [Actinospica robiniae]|uniref:hypothetical protein n=1 Tax=Actinospica robiniae TaxID=304901 RepID=UPI001FE0D2A4|nr:hypothetical protein [Actinospica robiniae]
MTLPASLLAVLENLHGSFAAPTFATFAATVTGLIAQSAKGAVTGMLTGAGLAGSGRTIGPTRSSPARGGTPRSSESCWPT